MHHLLACSVCYTNPCQKKCWIEIFPFVWKVGIIHYCAFIVRREKKDSYLQYTHTSFIHHTPHNNATYAMLMVVVVVIDAQVLHKMKIYCEWKLLVLVVITMGYYYYECLCILSSKADQHISIVYEIRNEWMDEI